MFSPESAHDDNAPSAGLALEDGNMDWTCRPWTRASVVPSSKYKQVQVLLRTVDAEVYEFGASGVSSGLWWSEEGSRDVDDGCIEDGVKRCGAGGSSGATSFIGAWLTKLIVMVGAKDNLRVRSTWALAPFSFPSSSEMVKEN